MKKQVSVRTIAITMGVVCVLLALPLILITWYTQPFADDYNYSMLTADAWLRTGDACAVLQAAFKQVSTSYQTWQGTYASVFFMSLQPGIFGGDWYCVSGISLILLFLGANLYFFRQVLTKLLRATWCETVSVASALTIVAILYIHDAGEGFYWFNGAIYYTGFYSFMLVFFGIITSMVVKRHVNPSSMLGAILLAFIIGGGNYSIALISSVVLLLITVAAFIRKSDLRIALAMLLLFLIIGFLISALAPGNAKRFSVVERKIGTGLDPARAILLSFAVGGYILASALNFPTIIVLLFITPFLYTAATRSTWTFRQPIPVIALMFCVYCTEATPPLFAMGIHIADRLQNIIYFTSYLFMMFSIYYILGWVQRSFHPMHDRHNLFSLFIEVVNRRRTVFFIATCAVFIIACIGVCRVGQDDSGSLRISYLPSSVEATLDILSGKAANYRRETRDRLKVIAQAEVGQDLVVPKHRDKMPLISYEDITDDPRDWKNKLMAQYYSLKSIRTE